MEINELTGLIINSCIKIHTDIGPGCFEKVYEEILYYELDKRGLNIRRQIFLPIDYEELHIKKACKLDFLVEDMLVVELKSLTILPAVAYDQVRTYLKLLDLKYGLLLNFKVSRMKEGIHRVFNNQGKECLL